MKLSNDKRALVTSLQAKFGNTVTRRQVLDFVGTSGEKPRWLFNNKAFRAGRGSYDLTKVLGTVADTAQPSA